MNPQGVYMNGASPVNNMVGHQDQKTIRISIADCEMINRKLSEYKTRLKAFENLQRILAKRDEDLAHYKKETEKYKNLALKYYEELYHRQIQAHSDLKQPNGHQEQFQHFQPLQCQQQPEPQPQRLSPQHLQLQQQHSPQQGQQSPQGYHSPPQGHHSPPQGQDSPQYQMQPSPQQQMQPSPQQQMQHSPQEQMQPSPQQQMQPSPQQVQHSPQHQVQFQGHIQVQALGHLQGQPQGHIQGQLQSQQLGHPLTQVPYTNGVHAPQALPGINNLLLPVGSQNGTELVSHGINGCASEAERHFSESDFLSLERVLAELNGGAEGAAMPPAPFGYHHYQDVQVDGDEDVSLASLKIPENLDCKSGSSQPEETSDRPKRPPMPPVSQKVLQEIVQNNLRLQKSLQEVAAVKGSNHSKLEYERVISNLRNQLSVAENRYRDLQSVTKHLENGDEQKLGELLKSYQNKIAYLQQIVALKQSLHRMFVQDSNKESSKPSNPEGSKDESAQTNDLESLTESFSQTSITDPSTVATEEEARHLAAEISDHQEELKALQQELRHQEEALEAMRQRTESQTERLRQTEEQIGEGQSRHKKLLLQCEEHERKLTKLRQEITLISMSRDEETQRQAEEKRATLEKEEVFLTQLKAYEEDYMNLKKEYEQRLRNTDSQLEMKDSQLHMAREEINTLKCKLEQQRQYIEGLQMARMANYRMQMGPVINEPWMSSSSHLPMVVSADGPTSSLPSSLRSVGKGQSSLGPPSISDRSPSPAKPLECPRCQRNNFDSVEYYREHLNKCTDT